MTNTTVIHKLLLIVNLRLIKKDTTKFRVIQSIINFYITGPRGGMRFNAEERNMSILLSIMPLVVNILHVTTEGSQSG